MTNETKKLIADYFDAWELVEYLRTEITTEDIIDRFPEVLEEAEDDILELMGVTDE